MIWRPEMKGAAFRTITRAVDSKIIDARNSQDSKAVISWTRYYDNAVKTGAIFNLSNYIIKK